MKQYLICDSSFASLPGWLRCYQLWSVTAALAIAILMGPACNRMPAANDNPNEPGDQFANNVPKPRVNAEQLEQGWLTLDNRHEKPADFAGQVLVLDFYATWCPPCRDETPHLVSLQHRFGPEGLSIVGLNVGGEEDRNKVPRYVKEFGIPYKLGFPDDETADLYLSDNDAIPQTYVFDRKGRLVRRFIGYQDDMSAALERTVRNALAATAE